MGKCYLVKLKGNNGTPQFTDEEIQKGFEQVWLPYDEALKLLSQNTAVSVEGRDYIVPRDRIFLEEIKQR